MIRSIRRFLLISLLLSITLASSITAVGNYLLDKNVAQNYLDQQLVKIYSLVRVIDQSTHSKSRLHSEMATYLQDINPTVTNRLLFQIWTKDGKLLISSLSHLNRSLFNAPAGFSDLLIGENLWRIYTGKDELTHNKIVVAEVHDLRNQLADDIALSNAYVLLITYPILGLLVWIIIGLALSSINRVTNEISDRASTHLEPVNANQIPIEIKPLVVELNFLFNRLKSAFERNKRFSADAAHELRTPLAALRTQAQVAIKADNEADRNAALAKVLIGVDRSSHMVTQLLTLSRLGQEEPLGEIKTVDLHKLTTEILAFLATEALDKNIELELAPPPLNALVLGDEITLGILIRNIVDNAIRYTPFDGEIQVKLIEEETTIILSILDSGPGVPSELRERVFERFFRILGTKAPGSGLGLAIVKQIADLHGGKINLTTPLRGHGLQFSITFPKSEDKHCH